MPKNRIFQRFGWNNHFVLHGRQNLHCKENTKIWKYRNWTYRFKSQPTYLQGWKPRIIHMLINEDKKLRVKREYFRNFRIKCSQEGKQKNVGVIVKMQM